MLRCTGVFLRRLSGHGGVFSAQISAMAVSTIPCGHHPASGALYCLTLVLTPPSYLYCKQFIKNCILHSQAAALHDEAK